MYDFAHLGGTIIQAGPNAGNIVPGTLNVLAILESCLRNGNNVSFGLDPDCH